MIDLEDIKKDIINRVLVSSGKILISKEVMSGLNLIQTIAQQEIKNLTSKHGSAIGKLHFTEKKLGEAQKEISQLKAKLAKYESGDYVLVPKEPTDKISETMCEVIWQVHGFQVSDYFNRTVYESMIKAMIEAGEIK